MVEVLFGEDTVDDRAVSSSASHDKYCRLYFFALTTFQGLKHRLIRLLPMEQSRDGEH